MKGQIESIGAIGRNVAANIARLRGAQNMTSTDLSEAMGKLGRPVPATGLTRVEHLCRRVDVDDLAAFAQIFGVEPVDLLADAPACRACDNRPPAGFTCNTCGTGTMGA